MIFYLDLSVTWCQTYQWNGGWIEQTSVSISTMMEDDLYPSPLYPTVSRLT